MIGGLTSHLMALDAQIRRIDDLHNHETHLQGIGSDYQLAGDAQNAQTQIHRAQAARAELLGSLGNVIQDLVQEASVNHRTRAEISRDVEWRLAAGV